MHSTESVDLWLLRAGRDGAAVAQLLAFRSRVLQGASASAPTHLYATKWERRGTSGSVEHASRSQAAAICVANALGVSGTVTRGTSLARHANHPPIALVASVGSSGVSQVAALPALEGALLLLLAQATAVAASAVWLLSRGVLRSSSAASTSQVAHAGAWGLSRAVRQEAPATAVLMCVELGERAGVSSQPHAPLGALLAPSALDGEHELALDGSSQYAPRLGRAAPSLSGPVRLHFASRGAVSNLSIQPQPPLALPSALSPHELADGDSPHTTSVHKLRYAKHQWSDMDRRRVRTPRARCPPPLGRGPC